MEAANVMCIQWQERKYRLITLFIPLVTVNATMHGSEAASDQDAKADFSAIIIIMPQQVKGCSRWRGYFTCGWRG
jgi:hypothetical protein